MQGNAKTLSLIMCIVPWNDVANLIIILKLGRQQPAQNSNNSTDEFNFIVEIYTYLKNPLYLAPRKDWHMLTIEEVKAFLEQFNIKAQVFGIRFRDDRPKNRETLLQLEITHLQREMIVKNLQTQDYVEGPVVDILNKEGEMWVFGKDVKGREVYIKITLGYENGQTICISFHLAESPLQYPFKKLNYENPYRFNRQAPAGGLRIRNFIFSW